MPSSRIPVFLLMVAFGVVTLPLLMVMVPLVIIDWETGSGVHVGYVTATEYGGVFFKTSHIYFKTDAASTQEDEYCARTRELESLLQGFSRSGSKVEIKFTTYLGFASGCVFDSKNVIDAARELSQ